MHTTGEHQAISPVARCLEKNSTLIICLIIYDTT